MTQSASDTALRSMTGFASATGAAPGFRWTWELRGVNGKGLDLRLRIPEWIDGLEQGLRTAVTRDVRRGSLTMSLRLIREEGAAAIVVNTDQVDAVLAALRTIATRAERAGVTLAPSRATDIASMRGVLDTAAVDEDTSALRGILLAEAAALVAAFDDMRRAEGAALADVLRGQLEEIAVLAHAASEAAEARKEAMAETLRRNLAKVLDGAAGADEDRVAQELALIAVKADVTEEIDRLRTHVAAARELIGEGGAVGRKLDFLMQEFNREANTLCSKAQNAELTRIGLALKALIDQMREQVQNVE